METSKIITDLTMPKKARKGLSKDALNTRGRKINSATMTPDRGFVKQLKKLDSELEVVWNYGSEYWEIWKKPKELGVEPHMVTAVKTKNKTYKELGQDVLLKLRWGRPGRFSAKELCDYFEELDNQDRRRKRAKFMNEINSRARDLNKFIYIKQIQVPRSLAIQQGVS